jgi:hypothetical protein
VLLENYSTAPVQNGNGPAGLSASTKELHATAHDNHDVYEIVTLRQDVPKSGQQPLPSRLLSLTSCDRVSLFSVVGAFFSPSLKFHQVEKQTAYTAKRG